MKVKEGFMLREVGATKVIIAIGPAARDFHAIAHVNTSGSIIFQGFKKGESAEAIAKRLTEMFFVDMSHAKSDVDAYADKLVRAGIMEA